MKQQNDGAFEILLNLFFGAGVLTVVSIVLMVLVVVAIKVFGVLCEVLS